MGVYITTEMVLYIYIYIYIYIYNNRNDYIYITTEIVTQKMNRFLQIYEV